MTAVPSRRRSRIAHFKVPFVISIAAPAAGMACGGQSESLDPAASPMRDDNGTYSPPSHDPPRPLDVSTSCSETMPTAGSDCAPDGQVCLYPGCEGPQSSSATCTFGQWEVVYSVGAACNPPAVIPVCPIIVPTVGGGCAYEGQACVYGVCGDPDNPGFFDVCLDGVWQQPEIPCAPPAAVDAGAAGGGS